MSKLLMSSIAASLMLSAESFDITKFIKNSVVKNPQVKVSSVDTIGTKKISKGNDWKAYLVIVNLSFKGQDIKEPMTIFVDEKIGLATMNLMNIKTGEEYQRTIKPSMPESYYDDAHLIAGEKNAKHKMVIFSDPQCPFCIQYVPKMFKNFNGKKGDVALYYYHMPLLQLHPVSDVLTRVMEVLQKRGKIDEAMSMYKLKISAKETNADKILAELKKQLNIKISKNDIEKKEIKDAVKKDMEAASRIMIRGTPAVYFDGEFDASREKYKQYLK